MNSLFTEKVLPTLNGMREAKVTSYEFHNNDNGGYLQICFQLEDRIYVHNVFAGKGDNIGRQINYTTSAIRRQLGMEQQAVSIVELLDILIASKTAIKIWFSYNTLVGRLSVNFHEPAPFIDEEIDLDSINA